MKTIKLKLELHTVRYCNCSKALAILNDIAFLQINE